MVDDVLVVVVTSHCASAEPDQRARGESQGHASAKGPAVRRTAVVASTFAGKAIKCPRPWAGEPRGECPPEKAQTSREDGKGAPMAERRWTMPAPFRPSSRRGTRSAKSSARRWRETAPPRLRRGGLGPARTAAPTLSAARSILPAEPRWSPVPLVLTCAQCREQVLEVYQIGDDEECLLRDHLLAARPNTIR